MVSVLEARQQLEALKTEIASLKMSYHQLREVELLVNRTLAMLEQATGSPDLKRAIDMIQRVITLIRILQFTIMALKASQGDLSMIVALSGLVMSTAVMGSMETTGMQIRGREA